MKKKVANNRTVNGWQSGRFDSRIQLQYGASLPESKRVSGNVPVFGSNGRVGLHAESLVKGPGIIVGRKGTIGAITWSNEDFWPIDTTYYIESNPSLDLRWLFYKLQTLALDKMNTASGTPGLNREEVYRLQIEIPPLPEQEKIAEILGTVDEAIAKTDEIIVTTEKLKKGLMCDFFSQESGHTKFKRDSLNQILDLVIDHRGITPKKLGGEWSESGVPAISAMNVKNGRIVKPETIRFVNDALYKKWMSESIQTDDVVLTSEAPLGEVYLTKPGDTYCLSQRLFALRTKKEHVTGSYLYYFLMSPIGRARLLERATGSTAKGIRQAELRKIIIDFPEDVNVQEKFSDALSSVDQSIEVYQELQNKLVLLKKGLMQDLLSGTKRV